ncbi:hypothetical protein GALMADRAFT_148141 [Galerina marginata CBS 339.88]|uniref:Uncharacterized protein n=1 Tax=Galerina marginata (strain CBS 339.88) TaxID=685588 RepID=A0A067SH70_GALM3|nr:hypothetical protein GALMADRAFT_148141 [Galerina marginata CBS 339.88]
MSSSYHAVLARRLREVESCDLQTSTTGTPAPAHPRPPPVPNIRFVLTALTPISLFPTSKLVRQPPASAREICPTASVPRTSSHLLAPPDRPQASAVCSPPEP